MKTSILALAMTTILSTGAFAADSDTDSQMVTITVPAVALFNINDAGGDPNNNLLTISDAEAPTVAGQGFTTAKSLDVTYDLSSNIDAANPTAKRSLSAKLDADLPASWKLTATATSPDGSTSGSETPLTTTNSELLKVGNENTNGTAQKITYKLTPSVDGGMMAYATGKQVTITYTLTPDA